MPKVGVVSCDGSETQSNHKLSRVSLFVKNFVKLKISGRLNSDLVIQIACPKVTRFYYNSKRILLKIDELAPKTQRALDHTSFEILLLYFIFWNPKFLIPIKIVI